MELIWGIGLGGSQAGFTFQKVKIFARGFAGKYARFNFYMFYIIENDTSLTVKEN
jgi:hypothetical protein